MKKCIKKNYGMVLVGLALTVITGTAQAETRFAVQDSNGNDAMVVTEEGKIGIGTGNDAPLTAIHIRGVTAPDPTGEYWRNATFMAESSNGGGFLGYNTTNTSQPPGAGVRLGYAVFGAFNSTAAYPYHAVGMAGFAYEDWNWSQGSLSTPAYLAFSTTPSGSASRTERVRITHNGNVIINAPTDPNFMAGSTLYVNGSIYSTGSVSGGSDIRFKNDLQPIGDAVSNIMKLKGVSFTWKMDKFKDKGFPGGRHYGVVAQEVEKVLPEVVNTGPDGYKAVAYTEIIPVLIEAIKEQQKQIDALQKKLSEMK